MKITGYGPVIVMGLNTFLPEGSIIEITKYENLNYSQFFVITGHMPNKNTTNFEQAIYTFDKTKFSRAKSDFCFEYGCSQFDIQSFMSSQDLKRNITYQIFNGDVINQDLWNNFRLENINENKLKKIKVLASLFYNFRSLDFETDFLGYIGYYKFFHSYDKETNEYVYFIIHKRKN